MKTTKAMAFALILIIMVSVLSACSGGNKIPNGRYEPEDDTVALTIQAIIIDGDNFTVDIPFVGAMTVKYTYNSKTGAIALASEAGGFTAAEYKDGAILFGGAKFTKG